MRTVSYASICIATGVLVYGICVDLGATPVAAWLFASIATATVATAMAELEET